MAWLNIFNKTTRFEKAAEQHNAEVEQINKLSDKMQNMSDKELKETVTKHRGKDFQECFQNKEEIFAAVREASNRTLKMRHFDVQLQGGLALMDGKIAEMKTGEGKTLVATLPLVLHGLTGKGAHLITVNEYLASRDADWMRPVYEFFDLSVGVLLHNQSSEGKRAAYAADITYGTNNEFGFDYMRDNMAQSEKDLVQRELNYAIVDEVDSILIDEARTPLIISAPDAESTSLYTQFSRLVPRLQAEEDYNIDEKRKAATLTDSGITKVEEMLGIDNIYENKGIRFVHHLEQALRAHTLFQKDKDYVVKDGQVMIVDEFTGRLMEGRRYSEGLHQAIEAKEGVKVQQESRTLATITFQNLFRLYNRLAGMTGTAVTSAEEFEKVYNLDVVAIPTNKKLIREDKPDRIYVDEKVKFRAVVQAIKQSHQQGQPVLVGTIAIEKSEYLSKLLTKEGIQHEVLNAKQHAREAEIISKAGQKGSVTISTNMAGRGTDIKLGENVDKVGGLFVLGTERHEARRIDNQLRGRAGRQGDPGMTQFYVSLEDDVMRIFGGEKIRNIMNKFNLPEDEPIENKMVTRAIDSAQEKVEGYYFDMRKQVLSYDDVLNRQRTAIYTLRRGILLDNIWKEPNQEPVPLHDYVTQLIDYQAKELITFHCQGDDANAWNLAEIAESTSALTNIEKESLKQELETITKQSSPQDPEEIRAKLEKTINEKMNSYWNNRVEKFGRETVGQLEKAVSLRTIDTHWMNHLDAMDYLRTGIGLRGYGQKDPLVEYQREGYQLFLNLINTIKGSLLEVLFRAQPAFSTASGETMPPDQQESGAQEGSTLHNLAAGQTSNSAPNANNAGQSNNNQSEPQTIKEGNKVGRNDPCPCGSGKKYKKCHGK